MFMITIFRTTREWLNIVRIIIVIERFRSSKGRVPPAKKPGSTLHSFKVRITSMGILNICNLWILLRKIVIYLVGRKCHLHGLFRC